MAKTKGFIDGGLRIEDLIVRLIEMEYLCLSGSDFRASDETYDTMKKFGDKCFYSHMKRCHQCELECVSVFNPSGKYYLELDFDYSGQVSVGTSRFTIGKSMYSGEKAIDLANRFMFKK